MAFMLTDNRILDDNGRPLSGGKVYVYEAGTTTPIDSFPTAAAANAGTPVNSNPVILNAAGIARIYGKDDVVYKVVIKDRNDTTIETIDNISLNGGESAAAAAAAALAASASASSAASSASAAESSASSAAGSAEAASESAIAAQSSANLATPTVVNFAGDGSTTDFELPYAVDKNSTNVFVDGVYQRKVAYTILADGTTLRFLVAPANGVSIEVNLAATSTMVSGDTTQVNYNNGASGAVTRNVRDKLRENTSVEDFGSLADAIAYAVSAGVAISVPPGTTVNIPSDAATLQQAISHVVMRGQAGTVTLNIESGHAPASGIKVANGDFSNFIVTADDATVSIPANFSTMSDHEPGQRVFIECINGIAPTLGALIDAQDNLDAGYLVAKNSQGRVERYCGVINSAHVGLWVTEGSRCDASFSNFSGASERCFYATNSSLIAAAVGNASGQRDAIGSGLYASRGSVIHFAGGTATNCTTDAVVARRSRISVIEADLSGAGRYGIDANEASQVAARDANVSGAGDTGALVRGGSTLDISDGDASGCGVAGIQARGASLLHAHNAVASNSAGYGAWAREASTINFQTGVAEGCNVGVRAERVSTINASHAVVKNSVTRDLEVAAGSTINILNGETTSGTPSPSDTSQTSFNTLESNRGVIWGP